MPAFLGNQVGVLIIMKHAAPRWVKWGRRERGGGGRDSKETATKSPFGFPRSCARAGGGSTDITGMVIHTLGCHSLLAARPHTADRPTDVLTYGVETNRRVEERAGYITHRSEDSLRVLCAVS